MTHSEESPRTGQVQGDSDRLRSRFDVEFTTRRADAVARCVPLPCGRRDPNGLVGDGADVPEGYTMPPRYRPRSLTLTTLRDDWTDPHRSDKERRAIVLHARALQRVKAERSTAA